MPKICYIPKSFKDSSLEVIASAVEILEEYAAQGYRLTLRQLYYQFVSRDLIDNKQSEYKRLGGIVSDARLAGLIDWDHLEDRTRNLQRLSNWRSPSDIVDVCARTFHLDWWRGQKFRPEVWIEKDALVGVIEGPCRELDVPYFSCRGYTSQSEMWGAAQRLLGYNRNGQTPVIIHLGDHDPSGIDMTRDIWDRLDVFMSAEIGQAPEVNRIALNMDQIEQYNPPPNPAKITDSRAKGYILEHGSDSWELDALEPAVMSALILSTVGRYTDHALMEERKAQEQQHREELTQIADNYEQIVEDWA